MVQELNRQAALLENIHKGNSVGVEVGPLHNPLAPKKDGWKTTVVDWADRDELVKYYKQNNPPENHRLIESIEDVDIVWKSGSLGELLCAHRIEEQDYFVSSHNIEHTRDIIDYLRSASSVLKLEGIVAMAIPDLRFCFDYFRCPSSISDALRVFRTPGDKHEPTAVLDARLNACVDSGAGAWITTSQVKRLEFSRDPIKIWDQYSQSLIEPDGCYVDCHRWCFTPASFELLIFDMNWTGMCDLQLSKIQTAETGVLGSEFFVQLTKNRIATAKSSDEIKAQRLKLQLEIIKQLAERTINPLFTLRPR
jgi:hypothetical protein